MSFSPALAHRQRKLAEQAGAPEQNHTLAPAPPSADTLAGQEYAALRVLLHDNLRTLSDTASIEARNPKKAEYARAFIDWIEGVLTAGEEGNAAQDEILVTNMVWAIDYRDFDYALRLGAHVLRFNLAMPERYNRTTACFLAEDIATVALAEPDQVTLEQLVQVLSLVEGADMPDPAKAKLHKAIGRAYRRRGDDFDPAADNAPAGGKAAFGTEALAHFNRALKLDDSAGVKTDIRDIERQLKALAANGETTNEGETP